MKLCNQFQNFLRSRIDIHGREHLFNGRNYLPVSQWYGKVMMNTQVNLYILF